MAIKPVVSQEKVNVKVNGSFQKICPFPVGFIYQSFTPDSPMDIFGGNWVKITGRFLYCNESTRTGGSNSAYIRVLEIPEHKHPIWAGFVKTESGGIDAINYGQHTVANTKNTMSFCKASIHTAGDDNPTSSEREPFDKMPAYQSCYAWRRVS